MGIGGKSLGSLVVGLEANMANLSRGLAQAEKSVKGYTARAGRFIQQHKRQFLIAGAAITGALTIMIKKGVEYGLQLDKMAKTTKIATEEFSRLAYAAEQEHASLESLEKGLINLTVRIGYAVDGLATYTRAFDGLGISIRKNDGTVKSAYEVFLDLADAMSKVEVSTKDTSDALMLLGIRSGKDLIPMLKLGREGLKELGAEAEKLGLVMDRETAAKMKKFADAMDAVKLGIKGVSAKIAEILIPYLEKLAKVLKNTLEWFNKLSPGTQKFLVASTLVAGALLTLVGILAILWPGLAGIVAFLGGGAGLIALFGGLAGAVGVVAAAFAGWNFGKWITEITGWDKELTKWFERRFEQFDKLHDKIQRTLEKWREWWEERRTGGWSGGGAVLPPGVNLGEISVGAKRDEIQEFANYVAGVWSEAIDKIKANLGKIKDFWVKFVVQFHSSLSKAFSSIILGTKTAKQAFKELGTQMLKMLVDFFVKWLLYQVMAKGMTAILSAFVEGIAAGLAQAWAPAAALASLATLGQNAEPAAAALIGTTGLAHLLAIPKMAEGGIIDKPTILLAGEKGPEAIVPLDKKMGDVILNFYGDFNTPVDIEELKDEIGLSVKKAIKGY